MVNIESYRVFHSSLSVDSSACHDVMNFETWKKTNFLKESVERSATFIFKPKEKITIFMIF